MLTWRIPRMVGSVMLPADEVRSECELRLQIN